MPEIQRERKRDYFAHLFWVTHVFDTFLSAMLDRGRERRYVDGSFHWRYLEYENLEKESDLRRYGVRGKKGYLIRLYGLRGEVKDLMKPVYTITEQRIVVRTRPSFKIISEEILSSIPGNTHECYSVKIPIRKMSKTHKQWIKRIVKRIAEAYSNEPIHGIFSKINS